jgi:outer membrane protein OmpA-like peptidoglycan-associated protein
MNSDPERKKEATMPYDLTSNRTSLFTSAAPATPKSYFAVKCAYVLLCGLSLALSMTPSSAEELTVDEMECALDPKCTMPVLDHRLRGVTALPSMRTPGSFDRTVNFAFNSAELTADARKALDEVAESLSRPTVNKYEIVISGHTDSVGTAEYNQNLSERRAEVTRQYLISQHHINPNRVVAKGYGKSQLLLPTDPNNEVNRRVQFQNKNYVTATDAAETPLVTPATPTTPAARPVQTVAPPSTQDEGL